MKEKLKTIIDNAVNQCFKEGKLKEVGLPDYVVEIPNNPEHGHFATNLPMTLASSQKRPPREIAQIIIDQFRDNEEFIEKMEIAGPGFINFTIGPNAWHELLATVLRLRDEYGRSDMGKGENFLVEFVSANPTGPLHLGHGRGAALGDTLCRILLFAGYDVTREFYINDAGLQINILGQSIYSRWKQKNEPEYPFPENGYHGSYINDLAEEVVKERDIESVSEKEAVEFCADWGKERMLAEIEQDLSEFRVDFDVWYKESEIYSSGLLDKALDIIKEKGQLYEEEGAFWIKTSMFGDDKDRVVKKSDGQYTYFASDIAYHLEKSKRGASKAINIWGADHHGYVRRVKAALQTNDLDPEWLSVLLIQLVKLWKGGQEVKMSKRAGHFVTLKELVEEVGVDAVRFVFLTKSHDSPLDFDIDIVKKHNSDNPVYYVQYAHARICSLFSKAESEGISVPDDPDRLLELLTLEEELALIRTMAEFPSLVKEIAINFEPHRLTYYLTDLASIFHRYFNLGMKQSENRIIVDDKDLTRARLFLVDGVRVVVNNGLRLLGIEAPEKM